MVLLTSLTTKSDMSTPSVQAILRGGSAQNSEYSALMESAPLGARGWQRGARLGEVELAGRRAITRRRVVVHHRGIRARPGGEAERRDRELQHDFFLRTG